MAALSSFKLHEADEFRYFTPKTWFFWRGVIINFCVFCLVGHWLEIPYCMFMDWAFHVVADDYDVWTDPLWVPYWVYGLGTVFITLTLLPLKIHILEQRKTMWGAALEFFVMAVVLCAALECIMGWIVNQPDALGEYPYWDNSQLPLNIFQQAWLVNDIFLGLVTLGLGGKEATYTEQICHVVFRQSQAPPLPDLRKPPQPVLWVRA